MAKKKRRKRPPPPVEDPVPGDAPYTPAQRVETETHTTGSPPPFERQVDTATIGTREENQRLLAAREEDGDEDDERSSPAYHVNEEADEFRNVWD